MVKEMAFIAYSVRDIPKARAFYRDTIGLKEDGLVSDHWTEFDVGGITFGLGDGTPLGIMPGTSFSATFEVDDVDAERNRLIGLGIPVTDIYDNPMCRSAFVTDPEGNKFGIHQRKPS
ncbi:MAG TPA: VOC family protein [Candidatus Elarobacter sp.]|jgi:catechol 2,3-dioxygenase-like lactoylglutathione lyase family enzyme